MVDFRQRARRIHFINKPETRQRISQKKRSLFRKSRRFVYRFRKRQFVRVIPVLKKLPIMQSESLDRQEIRVLVFVYGTLQRGRTLHGHLAGQRFAGVARTKPVYRLYRIDWYPGLVAVRPGQEGVAIHGEVWDVDDRTLRVLDQVEEVDSGLYERRSVLLQEPFEGMDVVAYFYLGAVAGCSDSGDRW